MLHRYPLCLILVLSILIAAWSAKSPAQTSGGSSLIVAEAPDIDATAVVRTFWLPGWSAVPTRRLHQEGENLPRLAEWGQVWSYAAPTFEFAYVCRPGLEIRTCLWPDEPEGSLLVFREKGLTFTQELVVERDGKRHLLLPSSSFEVREGTQTVTLLRIEGVAAGLGVSLEYEFDQGVPGPFIRVRVRNPEADVANNIRVILRSRQRGPWDRFQVIARPSAPAVEARLTEHPQKAFYFIAGSSGENADVTFVQTDDAAPYYYGRKGEWTVDVIHNIFKLGGRQESDFITSMILMPSTGGVDINLKTLRLILPVVYERERDPALDRGFATVQSPIHWAAAEPGVSAALPAAVRALSALPPNRSAPGAANVSDKAPRLEKRLVSEGGFNAVLLPSSGPNGLSRALKDLEGTGVSEVWVLDASKADFTESREGVRVNPAVWYGDLTASARARLETQLPDPAQPYLKMNVGDFRAAWARAVADAVTLPGERTLVLWPLVRDWRAVPGFEDEAHLAVLKEMASRHPGVVPCVIYGGKDRNLLASAVAALRESGFVEVWVGNYPGLWNDPAAVVSGVVAAQRAGASGILALTLGAKWPESRSAASWNAWRTAAEVCFNPDAPPLFNLKDGAGLLNALADRQWIVVASPLNDYEKSLNRLGKRVPHRVLRTFGIQPAAPMRTDALTVLIGTPSANVGIMNAVRQETAGLRPRDFEKLESKEPLFGFDGERFIITGSDGKGVEEGLSRFIDLVGMLEPAVKPEK